MSQNTEILLRSYNSVSENMGVHNNDFCSIAKPCSEVSKVSI